MRRDTLAFTLAGLVFGFVLGYMAAGWGTMPPPVAVTSAPAAGAEPARPAGIGVDAVKAMESRAAREPGDIAVRVGLGNHYMDREEWDEAIRWYREALALEPSNTDVRTDLGACYVSSGRAELGLAEFDAVIQARPDHRSARFNRGVALLNLGRRAEAVAAWEDLLERFPDDAQLARLRSRIDEIRATAASAAPPKPSAR